MDARQILKDVRHTQRRLEVKLDRVDELETIVNRCTTQISDMPRGGHDIHRREKQLAELIDMKDEIMQIAHDLVADEKMARAAIRMLDDEQQEEVLEQHYINGRNWNEIAEAMDLTPRQIYRLRDKAIAAVEAIFSS